MAKWGEGDPRWIVEERADATNVNNWHWSEKNATPWSKTKLEELLGSLSFEDGPVSVKVEKIKKCEGDATANNRKGKLIFLFEWLIDLEIIGRVAGSEVEYKGKIEIPNIGDENEADEVDINLTLDTKGPHEAQVRQVISKKGLKTIQDSVAIYIKELKEEFSKGLILPTDNVKPQVVTKGKTSMVDKRAFQNTVIDDKQGASTSNEVFDTKSFSVNDSFKANPERLYEILSEKELVSAWANGNVQWDFKQGGSFALFGGNVVGTFVRIEPGKAIETKWRLKSYPSNHYAQITFTIKDTGSSSDLDIEAKEVPTHLADDTQNGLQRYYLASIARTFCLGSRIC